jgi:predicted aspartyl protease
LPNGQVSSKGYFVDDKYVGRKSPTPKKSHFRKRAKLSKQGSVYIVPVLINGTITLDFVLDSGASDVTVPADVVLTLMRTGSIKKKDFIGRQKYRLADGSTITSRIFKIRSLKVGDVTVNNVRGSVAGVEGSLLLGQSFLNKFKSWSIDNARQELVLE